MNLEMEIVQNDPAYNSNVTSPNESPNRCFDIPIDWQPIPAHLIKSDDDLIDQFRSSELFDLVIRVILHIKLVSVSYESVFR